MKYKIKNQLNKKELKKSRMKPIPLMEHHFDKTTGMWVHTRRDKTDKTNSKNI